jgi:cytochrome c-type biogenesis protein CcmH/NrfG
VSYQQASKLAPKDYVPYSDIGSAYFAMKKLPEAEKAFLKAIELEPNNVSVYTKLYDLYYHGLRRYPHEMNAFFADALKNTNNDINIVKLYAFYLEEINDPESALPIWQSLLNLEPNNAAYKAKVETLQKKIKG